MKVLVTGGVKSGKSRFAEQRTLRLASEQRPVYLATTEFRDAEMDTRIQRHQAQRGDRFETREAPLDLAAAVADTQAPVLVECLTMWLNNWLHHERSEPEAFAELERLLALPNDLVLVLNEVGLGVMPENPLARRFADLSGRVGQRLGATCDETWWVVAGLPQRIQSNKEFS